ncbi:hypothetical protein IAT38_003825 [Cryptococcus sp. DSM 104549]
MAPPSTSTPVTGAKPRLAPKTGNGLPTTGRVTRLRAAKESTASPAPGVGKQPSLLSMGKEGIRKVSGKIGNKEKAMSAAKPELSSEPNGSHSESLKAYLRIRPPPNTSDPNASARPYLEIQSETDVLMRAPSGSTRHHIPKPPHLFSFDRVFPHDTPQSPFFTTTTLPLVEKLLQGENGLLFAYGVSNSGKSYTIQGGNTPAATDRGVLPRAIDVVFNSISGLESKAKLQPQGLADVRLCDEDDAPINWVDALAEAEPRIDEVVKVDRNFSYAVFVSYAEVYNDKIFDLLDAVLPTAPSTPGQHRPRFTSDKIPRGSYAPGYSTALNSTFNLAAMANGGPGVLKRQALGLKNDPEGNGKYIAGLKDIRVKTREEALAVFRSGQSARQVFGTLANRESSRSHGIFTIKVVRIHNGAPEDPDSAQVSRLAIVDLAGSERTRNTQTTGDRLKEAGNINKSLMVLGQCLEVLRSNQQKMAAPAAPGVKKRMAVVPFRHSKLTEIFQNFFVGDGRAVIVINVNPYDTGFDENSHVMRFSASAREVQTTASNKVGFPLLKRQISTQFSAFKHAVSGPMKIKVTVPVIPKESEAPASSARGKLVERESQGFVMVEEELEVVEENEESGSEDEQDPLVDYLFDQLKEMKTRLYESEMRNASIEVEVREEAAKEMQEAMKRMHDDFVKRLNDQLAASELKMDRKIDILTRTMTPAVSRVARHQHPASAGDDSMDVSMDDDASFESAIDESLLTSGDDSMISNESDPFLLKGPRTDAVPVPQVVITRDSLATLPARDSSTDGETTRGDITLPSEVADDDEEAVEPFEDAVSLEEGESAEETEEEEEDDEGQEADITGDEEESEEDGDSDESAFTLSDREAEDDEESSDDSAPIPRASTIRRKTGSLPQRATPAKAVRTPAKATPAARTPAKTPAASARKAASTKGTPGASTPGPLSERVGQMQLDDEDEDDMLPVKATIKKKRTLGKKIAMEDEIENSVQRATGAEVRRMVRGPL